MKATSRAPKAHVIGPRGPKVHVIGNVNVDLIMGPLGAWPQPGTASPIVRADSVSGLEFTTRATRHCNLAVKPSFTGQSPA